MSQSREGAFEVFPFIKAKSASHARTDQGLIVRAGARCRQITLPEGLGLVVAEPIPELPFDLAQSGRGHSDEGTQDPG